MARGLIANTAGNQLFTVIDDTVFSVSPTGVRTDIGALSTSRGHVGMKIGLNQLVIVDGAYGYVYDLPTHTFSNITADGWLGSYTVDQLGGYFSFIDPNSQQFYTSALEDALTLDALDFATANNSPDKLVGQARTNNLMAYFGEVSTEFWVLDQSGENTLVANPGTVLEVGLLAAHTAKELDNSIFWLGRDERGAGTVYRMEGLRGTRISTMAVEEVIQKAISEGFDVSQACAFARQQGGHSIYTLQVPGVPTTWNYDVASQQWFETSDFVLGNHVQHRGKYHAYAFGKHLVAGDDDIIYELDVNANTNAGDPLARERVSPHMATPGLDRIGFPLFELDCTVGFGKAGQAQANVMMQYSDDGGFSWSNWRTATLGAVGEKQARARFTRCGSGRDRVWRVRCTDNTPFAIVAANIVTA